jgi:hypothetical protein
MEAGQLAGGGLETDRLEFVAHHRYSRRKLARPTRDPAGDRAPVGLVLLAELGAQRRFLVADDQQVERDCGHAGIQQQRRRAEEPRLAQDDQQRGEVDGVSDPAVGSDRDEPPRRVPWSRCPPADDREDHRHHRYNTTPTAVTATAYQATGVSEAPPRVRINQGT